MFEQSLSQPRLLLHHTHLHCQARSSTHLLMPHAWLLYENVFQTLKSRYTVKASLSAPQVSEDGSCMDITFVMYLHRQVAPYHNQDNRQRHKLSKDQFWACDVLLHTPILCSFASAGQESNFACSSQDRAAARLCTSGRCCSTHCACCALLCWMVPSG